MSPSGGVGWAVSCLGQRREPQGPNNNTFIVLAEVSGSETMKSSVHIRSIQKKALNLWWWWYLLCSVFSPGEDQWSLVEGSGNGDLQLVHLCKAWGVFFTPSPQCS